MFLKLESVHEGGKEGGREGGGRREEGGGKAAAAAATSSNTKVSRVRKLNLAHVLPRSKVCFCLNQRRLSSPDIRCNAERLLTAFTPVMSGVISLTDRLFISDASTSGSFQHPPSIADEASPRRGKSTIVVAGCIFFLLANSICQTYYVRYASEEAESGGTYVLCWFSSIFQVLIYPMHMLAAWTRHRITVFREGSVLESNGLHSVTELIDRFRGPKRFTLFCLGMNALNFFGTYCWYLSLDLLPASVNFVVSKKRQ